MHAGEKTSEQYVAYNCILVIFSRPPCMMPSRAASPLSGCIVAIGPGDCLIADQSATFGNSGYHITILRVSPYALRVDVRVLKEGFDKFGSTSASLKRLDKMASR